MKISYSTYKIRLKSHNPFVFETIPMFVFRSLLGKELKSLTCLFKKRHCADCDLKKHCAYSVIFETPAGSDTKLFEKRNYASHPFILNAETISSNEIELEITMLGDYINYFSYIFHAVVNGGESGVGKVRTKYKVDSVTKNGNEIFHDGALDVDDKKSEWESGNVSQSRLENYLIEIKTPLRLQKHGKIISDIEYPEFLTALRRRMDILCSLYGEKDEEEISDDKIILESKTVTSHLQWEEYSRWSSRQNRMMKLGGVVGTIEFKGLFTPFERTLLNAGEKFNLGKNTAFGMGKIKVREFK